MPAAVTHDFVPYRPLAVEAEEAMRALAWLLRSSNRAKLRGAKPIVFDFFLVRWHFDAACPELVKVGDRHDAALRVHCSPAILLRVLKEPGFKPAPRDLHLVGDVNALAPLVDSLKTKHNVLALRATRTLGD